MPRDQAELLEVVQALREDLVADGGDARAQLGIAKLPVLEPSQDDRLPLAAEDLERELHSTAELAMKWRSHDRIQQEPYTSHEGPPGELTTWSVVEAGRRCCSEVMIVEYVRYEVPADRRDEFLAAYRAAEEQLRGSENCVRYEVAEGIEEPDHFVVRIEWDSLEGHERGFRGGAQFAAFLAKVKPFFGQIREMKHYRVAFGGDGAAPR